MPNQSQTQEVDYHELQMALASEANGQEIDIDLELELANSVDNHLEVPGDDFDFVTNEVNVNLI